MINGVNFSETTVLVALFYRLSVVLLTANPDCSPTFTEVIIKLTQSCAVARNIPLSLSVPGIMRWPSDNKRGKLCVITSSKITQLISSFGLIFPRPLCQARLVL